ncbi:MAG: HAMP domain-containing protein [Sphingobium sp.]|nr:HAMP domain-containing protein [Sphingobium sp.]
MRKRFSVLYRSMAGQMFIMLAVSIAATSIISLFFANQARRDDFARIRTERVIASAVDIAARLAREPALTEKMLQERLILGAAPAPTGVAIDKSEPAITAALARQWGTVSAPEVGQVPSGMCHGHKAAIRGQAAAGIADLPPPDCWIVRFTDSRGKRQAVALSLPRLNMPQDATMQPLDLLLIIIMSGAIAVIVARQVARPLRTLQSAAGAFSLSHDPQPIPENGPDEVRAALSTFNLMQERVREGFRERTQLLASISHDLQTPLTRLRLRLEQVEDEALRAKLLQDHHAMLVLVEEGLDLASSAETQENWEVIDIDSLLLSIAEDAEELGQPVRFGSGCGGRARVKVMALSRCIGNLVDNAVKYGNSAEISCSRADGRIEISVRDHGPGIEEHKLDAMFEPFTRGMAGQPGGRSGTGIGLTISRMLAMTFNGTVHLENMTDGGLRAIIGFDG